MRVLIVFNHPYEGSFCAALLQSVKTGLEKAAHEVDVIHLDHDEFDPVMRAKDLKAFVTAQADLTTASHLIDGAVEGYIARLAHADHVIFIFPIWWELMPALTKGFIDKVIFPGFVYDYTPSKKGMKNRLPKLQGVTLITTMNTPSLLYRFVFGNAIRKALLLGTFWKIGIPNLRWVSFNSVKFVKPAVRATWLSRVEKQMQTIG